MAKKSTINSDEIIIDRSAGIAYLGNAQAIVKLQDQPAQRIQNPIPMDMNAMEFKPWGDNNSYPNDILAKVEKNTIIPSTLMWKANQMSAGGLVYGAIRGKSATGQEIFEPLEVPEIDEWLEANEMTLYLEESLRDLYWWSQGYPDLYLNKEKTKIAALVSQEAMDCRFTLMNEKNGKKDFILVDGRWPTATSATWTKVAALDPYFGVLDQIKDRGATRYIYPISFSSPGEKYYQKAPWHSIVTSGWLDVAEKIPAFKKALMDNGSSFKYVINVPESWWIWRYKNWTKLSDAKRAELHETELTNFNKVLTGVKNAGKTLMLTFKHDAYGKQYTRWEIIPIQDKLQSGAYIEDSQEASSHILYSLMVDGTLIGNSPGKGMGAGSGSDKLRANNIFVINNKVYLDKATSPLQKIITPFNKWAGPKGEKIVWRGQSYMLATLDSGKTMSPEDNGPPDNTSNKKEEPK